MKKIELIIFDVNQTMFSLKKIEKEFEKLGLNHLFCEIWFNSVLKEGFALNKINKFISFKDISISILTSILFKNKIKNPEKISKKILQNFNKLKPVDGLEKSLSMLNILNAKMTTLTNGNKHTTLKLLSNNNLNRFIVKTFSIDDVKSWKPSPDPYLMVTNHYKVKPENTLMIACHSWDLEGAKNVGLQTGYIKSYEGGLSHSRSIPDYEGDNILELAENILSIQEDQIIAT